MFWNAKNGRVSIAGATMDYVSFGQGRDILIMIPGLGDGLTTVRGMALPLAYTYRMYARDYKVYIFSRKNHLETDLQTGYSTRKMAGDLASALKKLGISHANVLGVSQGGMIAQYLAIDYPRLVDRLVLAVTLSRPNETVQSVIGSWTRFAGRGDYRALMIDTAEKSYSESYLKRYRRLYPLLTRIGKPKDFSRFLVQAASCIQHDAYASLPDIACPTLVIGGENDQIVTGAASVEIASQIKDSKLYLYPGLGHAAYEEAKDFNSRVMTFFRDALTFPSTEAQSR